MITVYALQKSRAHRILWLLELLNADYRTENIARNAQTYLAPESLRRIHPLGKSPLLQDGDLTLAESGAIVEYLLSCYDTNKQFRPSENSPLYTDYLFWLHYAEGSLMPLLVMSLIFRRIDERKVPFFVKPVVRKITGGVRSSFLHPQLKLHLDFVEQQLNGRIWLLGDTVSGADVMMSFPLQAALSRQNGNYPNIAAYVARIAQDPAYRRAEEKFGTFEL